jgi:hypothetical protein
MCDEGEALDHGVATVQGDVKSAYVQQRVLFDAFTQLLHKILHLRRRREDMAALRRKERRGRGTAKE